jgi:hypothetical protein
VEEDAAVAGINHARAFHVDALQAEGGADEAGDGRGPAIEATEVVDDVAAEVDVAGEPEHVGRAVELAEPAAEAGGRDETAPAPADEGGADEGRGVGQVDAEEDLLGEIVQQRRRRPAARRRGGVKRMEFVWLLDWGK